MGIVPCKSALSRVEYVRYESETRPRPKIARLRLLDRPCALVRLRHRAVVERLVEHRLLYPVLAGDLAQRAAGGGGGFHDLGSLVVPDVRVERGGCRQRQLRVPLEL